MWFESWSRLGVLVGLQLLVAPVSGAGTDSTDSATPS